MKKPKGAKGQKAKRVPQRKVRIGTYLGGQRVENGKGRNGEPTRH